MNQTRARRLALYVLCTGMLMIVLDATIVNVALPSIQSSLGFSEAGLAWVVNAYLIAFGGLLLLAGRLGDLLGQRRVFLAGLMVFTAASVLCGVASSPVVLVTARFVQGAGGALTSAVILGMIVQLFPEPREQAKAIGVYAFVASAGGAVGLMAGGVLTELVSWHWIFLVNVPIGVATAAAGVRLLPSSSGAGLKVGADVLGAVLVTSGLMALVYTIVVPAATSGWAAGATLAWGAVSAALLGAFLVRQHVAAQPLVPLRIFRSRVVVGTNLVQVFGAIAMFGSFFLGSLYLQHVLGYGPLRIGLAFLPVTVLMGVLSLRYTEPLVTRLGAQRVMVPGLVLIGLGLAWFARVPADASLLVDVLPATALMGIGAGLCFPPMMALAMSGVAPADAGLASGLINATGQVGGAAGLAVLATLAAGRAGVSGYHLAFGIAAGLVLVPVIVSLTLLRPSRTYSPADLVTA
jgi:EmrB/QacA subfamily drug resistance transporter